jgi:orotate phosphoribosyltransferase
MIAERIRDQKPTAVGGLEIGAYPIATAVSDALFCEGHGDARAFVVRKEPKKHGLQRHIEGDVRAGDRTIIVDDVITTGSSTLDAYRHAKEAGLQVLKIVAIVDREEENGRQNIEQTSKVQFEALCTLSDVERTQQHERKYPAGDARANQQGSDKSESSRAPTTR